MNSRSVFVVSLRATEQEQLQSLLYPAVIITSDELTEEIVYSPKLW